MTRISIAILTAFLLFFNIHSEAQEVFGEPDIWFLYVADYEVNEKFRVGAEFHLRFSDYLNDTRQMLLRPFAAYQVSDALALAGGYTYSHAYPYGKYPLPDQRPEHNIWEQVELRQNFNKFNIRHRYRLEHRWITNLVYNEALDDYDHSGFSFANRFRYRLTLSYALSEKIEIHLWDELFIRINDEVREVAFDQNWVNAGVTYSITKKHRLEVAYMYQYIQRTQVLFEQHPTLWVTVASRFK